MAVGALPVLGRSPGRARACPRGARDREQRSSRPRSRRSPDSAHRACSLPCSGAQRRSSRGECSRGWRRRRVEELGRNAPRARIVTRFPRQAGLLPGVGWPCRDEAEGIFQRLADDRLHCRVPRRASARGDRRRRRCSTARRRPSLPPSARALPHRCSAPHPTTRGPRARPRRSRGRACAAPGSRRSGGGFRSSP